jgi:adenylate cyclase
MAKEIELKLFFPPTALERVEAHPVIAGGIRQGKIETLESSYFDTPELTLFAARIALRTRRTAAGMVQTVKCAAESVGGLSSRPEWEQPYSGGFDFSAVDAPTARALLEAEKARLFPVFSTVFRRQTRLVEPRPGVRILIMVDTGHVVSAADQTPISELELELLEGSPADLQDLAVELAADLPLIPYDPSKAERGYKLFRKEPTRPLKAGKTTLAGGLTPVEAFRALAVPTQQCWQANLHGALDSAAPEFVHQLRVSLRRLNTLIRIFKPALPEAFAAQWSAACKELAAITGEVRDLDVMRESILEPMLAADPSAAHQALMQRAIAACRQARAQADSAFERLLNGQPLLCFVRDLQCLPGDAPPAELARFAEKRLGRLYEKAVQRLQKVVRQPTPDNAHRFRIALKHLRYSCEFFASLYNETAMYQYAKDVAALQDELGFINDLHVALSRFAQWSRDDASLKEVRDHIAQWHKGRIDDKLAAALTRAASVLRECQPWCHECERRGMKSVRQRLREGISIKLD